MTDQPKISVVLPVFNGQNYLAESLQSILNQSYANLEILVIDDGSTDKSAEIVRGYKDNRISLIQNEKNLGLITSLNKGLKLASGEFIARMDADDIAMPTRFEKQIAYLKANPEIAICGTRYVTSGSKHPVSPPLPTTHDEIRVTLIFRSAMAHPTVMIRRSVLLQNNISYNELYPSAEDYKLWTDLALCTRLGNLDEALLKYRVHEQQITQTKTEQKEKSLMTTQSTFLHSLGLSLTAEEAELHFRLSGGRGSRTDEELNKTYQWLDKLRQHLLSIHYAPETIIDQQLTRELRKACENSGLGSKARNVWKNCPWKIPFVSWNDRLRFHFKLITHYRAH